MNNDKNSHQITSSGTTAHPEQTVPDNSQGTHTVAGEGSRSGTSTTPKRGSVYDRITERVMELLQQGSIPWRKPWNVKRGFPRNLVSKKPYRGINVFLLHAMSYESPFWLKC